MNIRKHFNRWASGLALAMTFGSASIAQTVPLVPPGENPAFLNKIYERMRSFSTMQPSSSYQLGVSINQYTDTPNDPWLRDLKGMMYMNAEQEISGCLSSLCEYKYPLVNGVDKHIANISVLETMFHNGLNNEEFRTYAEFMARFEPSTAFKDRDNTLMAGAIRAVLGSDAYRNASTRLVPVSQITAQNRDEQFHLRRNLMQFTADAIRQAYGLTPLPLYFDDFPAYADATAAVMIPAGYVQDMGDTALILVNYLGASTNDIYKIIEFIAHEVRHANDYDDRRSLLNREFDKHDDRFTHISTIILNGNAQIPLCSASTYAMRECPEQYNWYRNQYIERSAFSFGEKFIQKLREQERQERARNNSASLRSLEAHKLQLPA